jgi:hypothetical protein
MFMVPLMFRASGLAGFNTLPETRTRERREVIRLDAGIVKGKKARTLQMPEEKQEA